MSSFLVLDSIPGRQTTSSETISNREARRLALARAGLMKPEWTGFADLEGRSEFE